MNRVYSLTVFGLCDLTSNQLASATDGRTMIHETLGVIAPVHDLNSDHRVNIVDVQIVVNAAIGLGCTAK